jgi:hypothetical protein
MTRTQPKPPWKRRNPVSHSHTKLSAADKARARARAAKAGRRYPNLIDNMYVAQKKRAGRS